MQRRISLSVRPSERRFSTYWRVSPSWVILTIATMCKALFRDRSSLLTTAPVQPVPDSVPRGRGDRIYPCQGGKCCLVTDPALVRPRGVGTSQR